MSIEKNEQIKTAVNDEMENLQNIVEAILFVAGEGLDKSVLQEKLDVSTKRLDEVVNELTKKYSGDNGIHLIKFKNKLQFSSNPSYSQKIEDILNPIKERQLSKATLETLAIIAYKQPITRLEIEDIRGVNSDYAVEVLDKHNLIEVVGRKDTIGKPLLFGTTETFLKRFDLETLAALPNYEDLLGRIKTIESPKEEVINSLYNEFSIQEEIPEFLNGEENIQRI